MRIDPCELARRAPAVAAVAAAIAAAACVPAVREVEAPVRSTLRTRLGAEPGRDEAATRAALEAPLTRSSVRQLALASPRAQAAMARLGVAAGEAAAMRSLGRTELGGILHLNDSGGIVTGEIEVMHDVVDVVLAAPRRRAGSAQLEAAQARAAADVVAIVAAAEDAYIAVAAASDTAVAARETFDAAAAAAELVERIHTSGGTTDLALAREQALREEARLEVARAEADLEVARADLDAALGLSGTATSWSVGERVAEIPAQAPKLDDLEGTSVATSLELAALRADALGAANRARAAGVKTWLPEIGAGVSAEYHDGGWFPGPAVRIGIPFLSGERGLARAARAAGDEVAARTLSVAAEVRARARAARMRALATYDEARHLRDVVVPLRRRVLDETILQYNAMNASPLELLTARRDVTRADLALLSARARFTAAMIAVDALRHGALPSTSHAAPAPLTSSPSPGAH
ncbi:MAG TPA: TolC family protein [Kofleriaceae bacterium]|nr:TolC family protein [Kofleriaceae bacterium]